MYRKQYGEHGYWCQVVFSTLFSFTHLCFRKASSVKKEESSKAKKNRRPISLDSGKEIMCTYWGHPILFMWRVIGRFYFHRNHDFNFFCIFFLFLCHELWLKMIRSFHVHVNNFFLYLNITCEWRMKWIKCDWQTILFNWQNLILSYFKEPNL